MKVGNRSKNECLTTQNYKMESQGQEIHEPHKKLSSPKQTIKPAGKFCFSSVGLTEKNRQDVTSYLTNVTG